MNNIKIKKIVLDPVMVAKGGTKLIDNNAIRLIKNELIKRVTLVTPNIPEAEILTGMKIKNLVDTALNQAIGRVHSRLSDFAEIDLEGKLNKQLADVSLLKQPFVKDPSLNIETYLAEAENCLTGRLWRLKIEDPQRVSQGSPNRAA